MGEMHIIFLIAKYALKSRKISGGLRPLRPRQGPQAGPLDPWPIQTVRSHYFQGGFATLAYAQALPGYAVKFSAHDVTTT